VGSRGGRTPALRLRGPPCPRRESATDVRLDGDEMAADADDSDAADYSGTYICSADTSPYAPTPRSADDGRAQAGLVTISVRRLVLSAELLRPLRVSHRYDDWTSMTDVAAYRLVPRSRPIRGLARTHVFGRPLRVEHLHVPAIELDPDYGSALRQADLHDTARAK
jgi:hypothetical protein